MPDLHTITRAQVAQLLGIAPATLSDHLPRLRGSHAFPAPIPCSGGRRYSRAQVVAWIDGTRPPRVNDTLEPDIAAAEAVLLGRARATLEAA